MRDVTKQRLETDGKVKGVLETHETLPIREAGDGFESQ